MDRKNVYCLIDGEREYQEMLQRDSLRCRSDPKHSVGDYLVMLKAYVDRAMEAWVASPGDTLAMDNVRKVAGIAVNCMEHHTAPVRVPPQEYLEGKG